MKSVVILAGGPSKRFGRDKGLVQLAGKPLILRVLSRVSPFEERIVVVSSKTQAEKFSSVLKGEALVVVDDCSTQSPLVGVLKGFKEVSNTTALLLPCDTPFVSPEVATLLLELCVGVSAVIPRWPNRQIEPLQAVYDVEAAFKAAEDALESSELNLRAMIKRLPRVRYVSTLVLKQLDPQLTSFFNVNVQQDLERAKLMLK